MYKNFNLTDEERKEIMEQHGSFGYKKPKMIMEETANSSLIGKSATFYASEREAQDAYKAGKSNPSAKRAIIGTITGMDKIENDYVSFKVKMTKGVHDDRGAVGKLLGGGTVFTYMRENGYFTVEGMTGTNYYSESVREILNKEFFTSDLASNNKMQPTSNMAEEIDTDDDCDVQLDKIIGYDSLGGGYRKKKMQEQGEPTSIPYPSSSMAPKPKPSKTPMATSAAEKTPVPATKVDTKNSLYNDSTKHTQIDSTDPKFGKNIKQSDKLIGKKATLYAIEADAVAAYQAGKSNPQSQGSIIVQVNSIDYSDNNTLQIRVTPDSAKTNYSTTTQIEIIVFNRVKGTFTIVGDTKVYYSESIKKILIDDYFSTELASNNKAQQSNMSEEIDTDDEEMELSKSYSGDDDMEDETPDFDMEFGDDPDEFEDLYDLSMAKQALPKDKMVDMSRSGPKDIDYNVAQDFYNKIQGMYTPLHGPKQPTSDYYLRTYGTPDPDMESETLANRKKNAPLDFPKYTKKDRNDPENLLSWEQKKIAMAQRADKEASRAAAREKRLAAASLKPGVNESKRSITLTESQLLNLIKSVVKKLK